MKPTKAPAIALALMLACGALAPPAAHGSPADLMPEVTAADPVVKAPAPAPETPVTPAPPAAPAPQKGPEREGNAFLRALAAPFRALARLFSGGSRKSSPAAKRREEKPSAAETSTAASPDVQAETRPAANPAPAPPPASVEVSETGVVRIIRPDEQPAAPPAPKLWVPVIEGVGADPLAQGRALLQHGHLNEAVAELSVAAARSENLVEANNLLGLTYDRLGQHGQAAEAYERALSVAPEDPAVLANFGYSRYLSNDFDAAFKFLRRAARLAPHLAVVHDQLGIVQARLGKYEDAFRSFARATNEYDAHVRIASMLDFEGRERQAVRHYEEALRLQPGTSAVLERLISLYERTGQRTKADTARRTLGRPRNDQRTATGGGG